GSYRQSCQHTAAVLLCMLEMDRVDAGDPPPNRSRSPEDDSDRTDDQGQELADNLLALFENQPARPSRHRLLLEKRSLLRAAFTLYPVSYGNGKPLFGLEMRAGPGKTYAVMRIRELLDKIEQGAACAFSRYCTYEPDRHSFGAEDDAVI